MEKLKKLVNLTRHDIYDLESGVLYPRSGRVANSYYDKDVEGISPQGSHIYKFNHKNISGLPQPEEGLVCIVSAPVLNAVIQECGNDGVAYPKCCSPHNTQRDKTGKPTGCHGFRFDG